MLPIEERTSVLRPTGSSSKLKEGDWVRFSKGHYKSDLAQVIDAIEAKVIVRVIPRLDIAKLIQNK